ncbi:MAG: sterol desaturase family protein [Desulfobacterota bacterium]|nr:sterol desaturase family protein [Thermodesulfobacteriota bacterium]
MLELKTFNLIFFWGGLALYALLERLIPYRVPSVSKTRRWLDNIGLAVFNGILLNLLFAVPIIRTAEYVTQNRMGLFYLVDLPFWLRIVVTVLFLDFMLYLWHFINHELPFFWRFHRVHHSDLNLDVSSASRFHLGELAISAVIKIALVYFLGAEIVGVIAFEILVVLTSQFHHSNIRVPAWFEKIWLVFFVPPSMHRIHHSVVIKERNTNYGTILSLWDKWLGTFLYNLDQARIRIGVGAYPRAEKVRFPHLLTMPFTKAVR